MDINKLLAVWDTAFISAERGARFKSTNKRLRECELGFNTSTGEYYIQIGSVTYGLNDIKIEEQSFKELLENNIGCKKKDAIEKMLIDMWSSIGMDIPSNYEDIVQFCFEDVEDTADKDKWHSGDVVIAFRRWIEEQTKYND